MRKRRICYVNDARHHYLFVFEPPMHLRDAWRPVDDVAGTNVDTFVYMVARGDGLFYPSKVGRRFGENIQPFGHVAYYRVWYNMQSLIDRGLDPLRVLIDRAHKKGMEFIASLRMTSYLGLDDSLKVPEGRGLAHKEVRDHQFAVLKELAIDYPTEGIELDLALAPGGGPFPLREEDTLEYAPVLTEWVREISDMVRNRSGGPGVIGARIYPSEETNLRYGLDIRTWLEEGLLDYVSPFVYGYGQMDTDMPIEWVIDAAHQADTAVYGVLQSSVRQASAGSPGPVYPTAEQARAAAANYWDKGVDGLYTWSMKWPHGDTERRILSDLGDPDRMTEGTKHYVLRERGEQAIKLGYDAVLPLEISEADRNKRYAIPLRIADDIEGAGDRIRRLVLKMTIDNLMSADTLTILLNGESLQNETCLRTYGHPIGPYAAQTLEFHLQSVRPKKGENILAISLDTRPENMVEGITVHDLELIVEYGSYPSALKSP